MQLEILEDLYAICQPDQSDVDVNSFAWQSEPLFALVNTPEECTLILRQELLPKNTVSQNGFRCFRVAQTMEFDVVGVIAGISKILAAAGLPIFVVSTYNTDYVLVKQDLMDQARTELQDNGYSWLN